ncbi:MAG TPA: hypothetical protein VHR47_09450 [Bacillota bacterium]|nr:hypothetical protein [Bacillota bacterium]
MAKIVIQPNTAAKLGRFLDGVFADQKFIAERFDRYPWWKAGLLFGLVQAVLHLLLVQNPAVCYLLAMDKVKDFAYTLPETMASVRSLAWFNLLISPLVYLLLFAGIAWLTWRISVLFRGNGSFRGHFAGTVAVAYILLAGQLITSLLVALTDLKHLIDLRDLTPGLGLGLFYYFSLERMGPFFWEVVRGFDLAGVAALFIGGRILKTINNFKRSTGVVMIILYYSLFLALRWVYEGPGHQFWLYFWTAKSI